MKKFNLKIMAAVFLAATLLTGCGISKMIKDYNTVDYSVEPEVLEAHGGKIHVTFKGSIPEKYFHPMATVELTPVLRYEGGETAFDPIMLRGESTTGDGTVIPKTGGSFTKEGEIDYKPAMNKSELFLVAKATYKGESQPLGAEQGTKLADGVIYTSTRVAKDEELLLSKNPPLNFPQAHGYKKETFTSKSANIYFAYNKSRLNWRLDLNKDEKAKQKIEAFEEFINKNWKVKHLKVNAWASPEGEENLNQELSEDRGETAKDYLEDVYKDLYKELDPEDVDFDDFKPQMDVTARGEDWEGFENSLENSDLADKDAILNVIRSQNNAAKRRQEIRNMTVIYKEVETLLEDLRRAEMELKCYDPKKSDEDIAELSTTHPDSLTKEELLYAATLTKDKDQQLKIYKNATKVYPEEWKGYAGAGLILLEKGKADEASTYVEKANTLSPNNKAVQNLQGVIASWKGNYDEALDYFQKAGADYNAGIIYVRKGEYGDAISKMSGESCKYNFGLAHLLKGNYSDASNKLDCAPKNGQTHYLMAVLGARTNNTEMMYENLKKAIKADSKYKDQAKDDREFLDYMNTGDFQNIVK